MRRLMIGIGMTALIVAPTAAERVKLTPEQQFARLTGNAAPGKPETCISRTMTQDSQIIYGLGIVYRMGKTYYLNRLSRDCSLSSFDILVTQSYGSQLCRGDIARIIDSGSRISKGSCVYGDFVPYKRPK